jgi:hypothetical protein
MYAMYTTACARRLVYALRCTTVGKAAPAEFKSQPEGDAETSYLLEWTSLSYTPITEFKLEVRREAAAWEELTVPPVQGGRTNIDNRVAGSLISLN